MRENRVFGHPQIILSFALTSLLSKTNLFSKGRFTKTYDDSTYLSIPQSSYNFKFRPVNGRYRCPTLQVWNLQVKEVALGSNYPSRDSPRGSLRSTNISKWEGISDSALFQPFLLTGLNALVFSLLAVDLIQTCSMNTEWRYFTWTSELKIKSLIVAVKCVSVRCHLPKALSSPLCVSPFKKQNCKSISGLATFQTSYYPFKGKSTKGKKEWKKKTHKIQHNHPGTDGWKCRHPHDSGLQDREAFGFQQSDAVSSGHWHWAAHR